MPLIEKALPLATSTVSELKNLSGSAANINCLVVFNPVQINPLLAPLNGMLESFSNLISALSSLTSRTSAFIVLAVTSPVTLRSPSMLSTANDDILTKSSLTKICSFDAWSVIPALLNPSILP